MDNASEIFDWLGRSSTERDPDFAEVITGALLETWANVRAEVGAERFDPVLGEIRPGRFGRRAPGAWTQTNGDHEGDLVNLTLELDAEELSLNLVGWFDPQLEKVERWLRTSPAKRFLRSLEGWDLLIFVREAHVGPRGRAVFRGAPGTLRQRIPLDQVSPATIPITLDGLRPQLDSDKEKLALHIRRSWSPEDAGKPGLDAQIAAEVERWLDPISDIRLA